MYFSINQLGRLAVLLLISTPFVAQAQKAGSSCGPVYDKTARWMSIPAKSLSATSPAGPVSVDSTGCVTSDEGVAANVHAALPWGTWTVYNISAKVKATKAAAKSSFMQVMIGSVDAPKALSKLRETAPSSNLMSRVFQHACTKTRLSSLVTSSPRRVTYSCGLGPEETSGDSVGFIAPGLTVCDVMVCASEHQFTHSGEAKTHAAAVTLAAAAAAAAATATGSLPMAESAAVAESGGMFPTSDGSVAPMAVYESCEGYTSQNWQTCPAGYKCVSTYKPGSCSCGHCSAFTGHSACQQGDYKIGMRSCCSTCPSQPVCAVCQKECVPEFERTEVIVGTLPTTPDSYNALAYQYTATTNAVNMGNNPQTMSVTFTFSQALTATMTYAKEFTYMEKTAADIGVPYLNKATVEYTMTQKFTTTTTNTATVTSTVSYSLQQQIPPLTMQQVTANASAGMITVKVPVTIKTYYTCDKVESADNTMIIQTQGVLNSVDSNMDVTYGPQYPLSPPIVLPQADKTCASNPQCAQYGLQGNCCPDDKGVYHSCCSQCIAKPACAEYASDNTTMCCPAMTNVRNACCDKK